jgi:hypothetical protein
MVIALFYKLPDIIYFGFNVQYSDSLHTIGL